ncbi:MAG: DNA repair protein RecO [Alphaproteobacteria bacterium]
MQWTDKAIIVSIKKYGENSAIITMLTEHHGLHAGIINGIDSANKRALYQLGNIVETTWKARLSEHLGNFSSEIIDPVSSFLMFNQLSLAALNSICNIINIALSERLQEKDIFYNLEKFLLLLKEDNYLWQKEYIFFELDLLSALGYGLDLSECAATEQIHDLTYISPKSGKAVSSDAGFPYRDKLFKLPEFFIDNNINPSPHDIIYALKITGHFLKKFCFFPKGKNLPVIRNRFIEILANKYNEELVS